MRAATEGSLPPVMPQGNLVEVLGREVRQGSPGELMVESTPSRQSLPPCKTNKEESDEAAHAAALTYLLTYFEFCSFGLIYKVSVSKGSISLLTNELHDLTCGDHADGLPWTFLSTSDPPGSTLSLLCMYVRFSISACSTTCCIRVFAHIFEVVSCLGKIAQHACPIFPCVCAHLLSS